MSFPVSMNALKDVTHCIVPSRIELVAYSCPLELSLICFLGHHIAMFCHPKSAIISFCSFMFIISTPLCCLQPYIHTKIIIMTRTPNNKSRKKKLRKKENAKGSFDRHNVFFEWRSNLGKIQWPKETYQEIQSLKREWKPTIQPKNRTPKRPWVVCNFQSFLTCWIWRIYSRFQTLVVSSERV